MRPLRTFLLVGGGLIALLAVLLGLALVPALQRWAVRRAMAGHPAWNFSVEEVAAGWGHATLRGGQFTRHGVGVKVAQVEADYSLSALLLRSRLDLDRLQVSGLEIDASRLSRARTEAGVAAAPAATPGALGRMNLPVVVVLGTVEMQGHVLLPGAVGKPAVQGDFQITGGGIGPGREGTLHLQARLTDSSASARVGTLQAKIDLRLQQSLVRTFEGVGLDALVEAAGPGLTSHDQLRLTADLVRLPAGENYRLRLDTVQGGVPANLLNITASVPQGGQTYRGSWMLTARTAQVEPFSLGGTLPTFDLRGQGSFSLNPTEAEASLLGELEGAVDELETLRPSLRPLGAVKFRSRVDVDYAAHVARLKQWELTVAGERPVLEVRASGALAYNFPERRLLFSGAGSGEVLRLQLHGLPVSWVRPYLTGADISGGVLTGEITVTQSDAKRLVATTVQPLRAEGLTVVRAGRAWFTQGELALQAEAELSPATATFRVARLELKTAAGDHLLVQGTVAVPVGGKPSLAITGGGEADLPTLLQPVYPGVPVRLRGETDLTLADGRLEVRRFKMETKDGKDHPIFAALLNHPFAYDQRKHSVETGGGEADLATLSFAAAPLYQLLRFFPDYMCSGETGSGEFILRGTGDHLVLRSSHPVQLTHLNVRRAGQSLFEQLALEVSPTVEFTEGRVSRVQSGEVKLRGAGGQELGRVTAEIARAADGSARGTYSFGGSLPDLATQPVFAGLQPLAAGRVSGEVRTVAAPGRLQVEARATLNGLVLREGNQALPVANLSLRAEGTKDGHLTLQVPVLIDRAGVRTDLNLALEGTRTAQGINFDAKLTSEHADLADALLLLGTFGVPLAATDPGSPAAQARALSPPAADVRPFWSGLTGQLALDLKSVTRGPAWTMTGLTGRLVVAPERLQLTKLEAGFGEKSRLTAQGGLAFAAAQNPYAFKGDFSLTEFDVGKLLKALEPSRPPTVEGFFTLAGEAEGQGLTLDDTRDRLRGELQLTSRQGIFRGLKRASDKLSVASKAVEWGAALGSLLGTEQVKHTAEKMAGRAYQVDQLAQALAEFNYDQLSLRLVREPSLNVQIQDVSLVSPELRLVGAGKVAYVAAQPLPEQPLSLNLALSVRGKLEQLLGKLGELDGTKDDLGYAKARNSVTLGGSLAKPDPRPYFNRLASSKLADVLSPDN